MEHRQIPNGDQQPVGANQPQDSGMQGIGRAPIRDIEEHNFRATHPGDTA